MYYALSLSRHIIMPKWEETGVAIFSRARGFHGTRNWLSAVLDLLGISRAVVAVDSTVRLIAGAVTES